MTPVRQLLRGVVAFGCLWLVYLAATSFFFTTPQPPPPPGGVFVPCVERIPKFVVYSIQRSGTHFLQELLNGYPSLNVTLELFHPLRPVTSPNHQDVEQQPWLLATLKQANYSIIRKKRLDLLAAFLSWETQIEHKDKILSWNCDTPECKAQYQNLTIRPTMQKLMRFIKRRENMIIQQERLLNELDVRHINVTYEELTTNTREELCRVIQFLGCDCALLQDTPPDIQKLHPKPKSAYFENWDEVVQVLKDTRYAWMLNT
ncbi:hypothetical protein QOT17_009893 [Balamuthia mandrillaris]